VEQQQVAIPELVPSFRVMRSNAIP